MNKLLLLCALCFFSYNQQANVHLVKEKDPDIVIVNIEDGDRVFIANLIKQINQCNPAVIGINAWFSEEKGPEQDTALENALEKTDKEVISYVQKENNIIKSHKKFRSHADDEGLDVFQTHNGLVTFFTPLKTVNETVHENFALKIVQKWHSDFSHTFEVNEKVPIHFQRTLAAFHHIPGSKFNPEKYQKLVQNKIVLLGYTGPTDENKLFTPIRNVINHAEGQPDTYGVVVVGNVIRTLLEQE